jgi:hypothetical protein
MKCLNGVDEETLEYGPPVSAMMKPAQTSTFDWGGIFNNFVTTAGNVAASAFNSKKPQAVQTVKPYTGLPITGNTFQSMQTPLLLAGVGAVAFFMLKKKGRK